MFPTYFFKIQKIFQPILIIKIFLIIGLNILKALPKKTINYGPNLLQEAKEQPFQIFIRFRKFTRKNKIIAN